MSGAPCEKCGEAEVSSSALIFYRCEDSLLGEEARLEFGLG